MKIGLIGFGKMGQALASVAPIRGHILSAILSRSLPRPAIDKLEQIDLLFDFSTHEALEDNLNLAKELKKPLLIGTTGGAIDPSYLAEYAKKWSIPIFYAANFSLGVHLFARLAKRANDLLAGRFDMTLVEEHQKSKKDAPSGTALYLKESLGSELTIHSIRVGQALPSHTLLFDNSHERISLTHSSKSRQTYAEGAIIAGEWLVGKVGFYTMDNLLDSLFLK
jgi:4-hydroxy-tetrahydrodipicolinate reductase